MNRDILKQIIVDQKEMYLYNPIISRNYDLEDNVNYCFVGVRRTGKSYMMYQKIHKLMNDGIPLPQIIYVNFEDEHLLEIGIEFSGSKGKTYLFLDEIQNVGGCCQTKRRLTKLSISFIFMLLALASLSEGFERKQQNHLLCGWCQKMLYKIITILSIMKVFKLSK